MLRKYFLIGLVFFAQMCKADFEDEFQRRYPSISSINIAKSFLNFYSLKNIDSGTVFISDDFKFLINGSVIDLESGLDLANNSNNSDNSTKTKFDLNDIDLQKTIKLGDGVRSIYVFSDPKCPYCKTLDQELKKLKNTSIYILPLPIESIHPGSEKIATSIWCAIDKVKAWNEYLELNIEPITHACPNPLKDIQALAIKYKINGTPTIVFEDGTVFPGLISAVGVEKRLGSITNSLNSNK